MKLFRKVWIALVVATYLILTGYFFLRHAIGDSASHPLAYFFTWDMFPSYSCTSHHRVAIAETQQGRIVELMPGPLTSYRSDRSGELHRFDMFTDIESEPVQSQLRKLLEREVSHFHSSSSDRINSVILLEEFWPAKFNMSESLYLDTYGEEHPGRSEWRVVEIAVPQRAEGTTQAAEDSIPLQWITPQ